MVDPEVREALQHVDRAVRKVILAAVSAASSKTDYDNLDDALDSLGKLEKYWRQPEPPKGDAVGQT